MRQELSDLDEALTTFVEVRPRLAAIAYRMLGSTPHPARTFWFYPAFQINACLAGASEGCGRLPLAATQRWSSRTVCSESAEHDSTARRPAVAAVCRIRWMTLPAPETVVAIDPWLARRLRHPASSVRQTRPVGGQ